MEKGTACYMQCSYLYNQHMNEFMESLRVRLGVGREDYLSCNSIPGRLHGDKRNLSVLPQVNFKSLFAVHTFHGPCQTHESQWPCPR